jgi:hypothetical protein
MMVEEKSSTGEGVFSLVGKIEKVKAIVNTDSGKQETEFKGEIVFLIEQKGKDFNLRLRRLNLLGTSVKCVKGESGLISLGLVRGSEQIKYTPEGKISIGLNMRLFYPLLTEIEGYIPQKEEVQDVFVPYQDTVEGRLEGEFEITMEQLMKAIYQQKELEEITELKLKGELRATEFTYLSGIVIDLNVVLVAVTFQNWIKIQPVFVRSDPGDASPTGWAFDEMMQSAKCMWKKCCIHFNVLDPIYVDDASYKHLDTTNEASNLKDEVDVDDAVEVFVASTIDAAIKNGWGGGATYNSGTASAKIVTCDDQLRVIDDATGSTLGAVNINHLAHELGHVLGLHHPNAPFPGTLILGTANTVMEPSGFYADNPHPQSNHNCDNADNPLMYTQLKYWDRRCIENPEL